MMEIELVRYFLPEELLENFDVVLVQELGELATKKVILEIHMEEKKNLPVGYSTVDRRAHV